MGGSQSPVFPFSVTPDSVVLGYAVLLAGLSSAAFGFAPALYTTRTNVALALGQREGLLAAQFPLRGVLLGVQVAVSVILLLSAGLLVRAVQRQGQSFDPGFSVDDVTVVSFELPAGAYDYERAVVFFGELSLALQSLPQDAVAFSSREPFYGFGNFGTFFQLPGETTEQARMIQYQEVSAGYMDVLRIPILAGRDLEPTDAGRPVVSINDAMARRYWPNDNPIGKAFFVQQPGSRDLFPREIVGVVRTVKTTTSEQSLQRQAMFFAPFRGRAGGKNQTPTLLVRTSAGAIEAVAKTVTRLDPRVRIRSTPLSASLRAMLDQTRWGPMLAGVLGSFALALATVGMFGVFAYAVRQRTREIGIRMALGARRSAVVRLVLAGHSRAVLVGLGLGWLGALAASQILRSRLHGLSPFDPFAYLGVAALLAFAGLAASYVPARRATRIDPIAALRCE